MSKVGEHTSQQVDLMQLITLAKKDVTIYTI